ncbi:MAG: hypothetical protein ACREQ9_03955, partial [Candidatus Binatia bacterium]
RDAALGKLASIERSMGRNWIKMYNKDSVLRVDVRHQPTRRVSYPQARAPQRQARPGLGADEKGRRFPAPLPPNLRADQHALPRRVGSRR